MNREGRHKLEHNRAWRSREREIERRSEVSLHQTRRDKSEVPFHQTPAQHCGKLQITVKKVKSV